MQARWRSSAGRLRNKENAKVSYRKSKTAFGWTFLGMVLLCAALSVTLGCRKAGKKGTGAASSDKSGAEEGKKGVCEQYADKVCKEVGEQTPACQSLKGAVAYLPPSACQAGMSDIDFTRKQVAESRKKCTELMDKLCADLGPKSESCTMVRTQTQKFSPQRCESLMQNYDKVLAQIKMQEESKKPLTPEKQAAVSQGPAPSFGPEDAKITIVEFSDFQCPYCARAGKVTDQVKEKYEKQVRFIFRQFPLSFHQNSNLAAQASLAADAQGKFWKFHDLMFENQRQLDRPSLEKYAKQAGLNVKQFAKALDDKTFAPAVEKDQELGKLVAVTGTPTMFMNGERVPNPTDFADVSKRIDEALKAGGS
jgi:protein-disulfide isomerase